jgi:hypothetical protein
MIMRADQWRQGLKLLYMQPITKRSENATTRES